MDGTKECMHVTLYAHLVRPDSMKFTEQVLVGINADVLGSEKYDDLEDNQIELEEGQAVTLIKVTPSLEMSSFSSVCVDNSSIFLVGGFKCFFNDRRRERYSYQDRECLHSISLGGGHLDSDHPTMLTERRAPCSTAASDGNIYVFGGTHAVFGDEYRWAEVFNIKTNNWLPNFKVPGNVTLNDARDCIFWENSKSKHMEKMIIVLVLDRQLIPNSCKFGYNGKAHFERYDLIEGKWHSFARVQGLHITGKCARYFLVAAGDFFVQVQGSEWHVYDLPDGKCIGKVGGLEYMSELPGIRECPSCDDYGNNMSAPDDVVYIGGRDGRIELCMLWQGYQDFNLYFARVIVEVEGLKGTICSICRYHLGAFCHLEKCHAITQHTSKRPSGGEVVDDGLRSTHQVSRGDIGSNKRLKVIGDGIGQPSEKQPVECEMLDTET